MRLQFRLMHALGSLLLIVPAADAAAQRVSADIRVGVPGLPIDGVIRVGDPYPVSRYPHRAYRSRPRAVVVDDCYYRQRPNRYRNARPVVVVVYYDDDADSYYDRPYRRGLARDRVYAVNGGYYRHDDDGRRYGRKYQHRSYRRSDCDDDSDSDSDNRC